jgi:rod shape-determining protein MreD
MRTLSFFMLAYLVTAIQLGVNGFVNWGGAAPNLTLPVVIFFVINARREEALIAALLLGLCQDLFAQQPMGLYTLAYGLVGLFVVGAQPAVYRDHPLTHFFITLVAALVTAAVVWFNDWAYPILHHLEAIRPSVTAALGSALFTALVAPLLLGILSRIKGVFGFRSGRQQAYSTRMAATARF